MGDIDRQLLREGAPIALEYSRQFCSENCRDYHGLWLYARMLNVLPSVALDHEFLLSAFQGMATSGVRRILVSGAADFGLLSYVLAAYRQAGVKPEITVLDRCRSPLEINRWYAQRMGVTIATRTADILDFDSEPYDLITTHSFMNGFAIDKRPEVVRRWKRLLRPGGSVVTANVITLTSEHRVRRFDDAGVENLVGRMLDAHATSPEAASISAVELEGLVRGFARRRLVYPVRSLDELTSPFIEAGFSISRLERGEVLEAGRDGSHQRFHARVIACLETH